MKKVSNFEQACLWAFTILCGIEVGAGLYEIRVIQPLMLHQLPDSVWKFSELRAQYPEFAINPGFRFWKFTAPPILLLSVSLLVLSFKTNRERQKAFLIASLLVIGCLIATALYFAPTTGTIMESKKLGLSAAETIKITSRWVNLNWVRLFFYVIAWITAFRSLVNHQR